MTEQNKTPVEPSAPALSVVASSASLTPRVDDCARAVIFVAKRWHEKNLTEYQFVCRVEALMDGLRKLEIDLNAPNRANEPTTGS
jgi:hypothetical protein